MSVSDTFPLFRHVFGFHETPTCSTAIDTIDTQKGHSVAKDDLVFLAGMAVFVEKLYTKDLKDFVHFSHLALTLGRLIMECMARCSW